ncbi:MAG: ABC transporter permease [Myxococcales bacterium]|nr:ABC transporter permease [Myxococcales bacterium]
MPFEWFVALRYMRDAKAQTALVLAAVSVGVSVIVFLSALIGGLQTSLIDKTLGSQAHITLRVQREEPRALAEPTPTLAVSRIVEQRAQRLRSIDQWPRILAIAESEPGVIAVSPSVVGPAFAVRSEAKSPIVVRGIEPERFLGIIDLEKRLVAGQLTVDGDDVVIGARLAADLGAGVGDKLRLASSEGIDAIATVRGIVELGNDTLDRTWVLVSLRRAQTLFGLPGGATTIELKVADVFAADAIAAELRARTGLTADSWMAVNAELLEGLSAQSSSKLMIQFFVIVAVALGIASVLIVSVVQRSREIGILRAVGIKPRRILLVFLIQGGVLGVVGSLVGCGLGTLFARLFESGTADATGAPRFPVELGLPLYLQATGIAVAVGLLSAALPARRAARVDPVTAIRNG